MAISSSLYASISGLSTMGEAMSVLGDNVSNVNTAAFKSSRSTFQDVLSQSVSTAAGGAQVGRGVTLSTINSLFAQGSFESSSSATDMAIGGQGFFMLRAADSAEADMYSRAGEFGFDQTGNLVNPMGAFVQGWTIDSTTGQRQGTIADINIGKNTPPVATTSVEVIANVDSRKQKETTEERLFANWDGTNLNAQTPTEPIDSNKYEYTTAVKIYDSKGASHDLTVYFDRTTEDNQWEFLVTCDPTEDLRALTDKEQVIYNPDTRYNYQNHAGAGALLYGILQFDTSGNISQIDAFNVPPDGQVDPAKNDNRILLESGSSYFSFPTNFSGADTNQDITINFGARYEGKTTTQRQVLVSDEGAQVLGSDATSPYVTSATTWANVADENGKSMIQGDTFILEGYNNGSDPVTRLVYTINPAKDVQDFLTQIENAFGCSAAIDNRGRLKLTDNIAGDSSMFVTRFETISGNGAIPFGGTTPVTNGYSITPGGITTNGTTPVTDDTKPLAGLRGANDGLIAAGDVIEFSGTNVDGVAIGPLAFSVGGNSDKITAAGITTDGTTVVADPTTNLIGLRGTDATQIVAGDLFTLTGTDVNTGVVSTVCIVGAPAGPGQVRVDTIQDLLDEIAGAYDGAGVQFTTTGSPILMNDGTTPVTSTSQTLVGLRGTDPTVLALNDVFTFSGTDVNNVVVPPTTFTVGVDGTTIQDLLDAVNTAYGTTTATLDSGRIRIMDATTPSTLVVTARFDAAAAGVTTANPFGLVDGAAAATTLTQVAGEASGVYAVLDNSGKIQVIDPYKTTNLDVQLEYDTVGVTTANPFGLTDGALAVSLNSTAVAGGDTIRQLLDFLDTNFGGVDGGVKSVLDQDGKIRLVDTTQSTVLSVNASYFKAGVTTANPFGLNDGAVAPTLLTQTNSVEGQINITTSKKTLVSTGRAYSTDTGDSTPITAATQWSSVFDDNRDPLVNSGLPRAIANGDQITFTGTKRDGTTVLSTFTVATTKTDGSPGTVQDLLDQLEDDFDCLASIDSAGRVVLTDRIADTVGTTNNLAISNISYNYISTDPNQQADIFGTGSFDVIPADVNTEDGSQQGDVVTTTFSPEALSTTQYANSSTTIFQDQDGFSSGFLQSVSTDVNGVITGHYSNGQVLKKAQVALANFSNLTGLSKQGGNVFVETTESGAPVTGAPGTNGLGSIAPNALEQSNVDLGVEFVKLITVQRGFQANSKIITTTDDMLNELINIKR